MSQSGVTVISDVIPAMKELLDSWLTELGNQVNDQTELPVQNIPMLHFLSFVIIESQPGQPQLVFESNFDGSANEFLQQTSEICNRGLIRLYSYCKDFDPDRLLDYLNEHIVPTNTLYVGCVNFSRKRIESESRLRDIVESHLDSFHHSELATLPLRDQIQQLVVSNQEPGIALAKGNESSSLPGDPLSAIIVAGLISIGMLWYLASQKWTWGWWLPPAVLVLLVYWGISHLRDLEKSDKEDADPTPHEHVRALANREDRIVQNHMASITKIKKGWFRLTMLKIVLAFINFRARYQFNKGDLSGISSIHFARWVIINEGKDLLFLSNFDGSWEHYLDEFIDRASQGLTAVWSNTIGFPDTEFLAFRGAADEQRFKFFARNSQIYTQFWYSAYRYLTVENILNNGAIRSQLSGNLSQIETDTWYRRF